MPWKVKKVGDNWAIVKTDTNEIVGRSTSKEKAEASVRARYTSSNLSEIRNMADFVKKVVLAEDLSEVEGQELVIDGKTYERIPESVVANLSGSMADYFGIKIKDAKGWVPKGRLKELVTLDNELTAELVSCVLFETK